MTECHYISPHCKLIHRRIRDIVRGIETDDGGECSVYAKGARVQRSDGGFRSGVYLAGVRCCEVALDRITDRDNGELYSSGQT